MKKYTKFIIAGGILLLIIMWGTGKYNTIVTMDESATGQWANVESSYQRRLDLIPNLVNVVKGYADFEKETLQGVIEARSKATSVQVNIDDPSSLAAFQNAQQGLSSALSRLLVTVERYPDLKANTNFLELQAQLEGTENRINVERNKYNDAIKEYNAFIRKIPNNLIAGFGDFEKREYFKSDEGAAAAPKVEF